MGWKLIICKSLVPSRIVELAVLTRKVRLKTDEFRLLSPSFPSSSFLVLKTTFTSANIDVDIDSSSSASSTEDKS